MAIERKNQPEAKQLYLRHYAGERRLANRDRIFEQSFLIYFFLTVANLGTSTPHIDLVSLCAVKQGHAGLINT